MGAGPSASSGKAEAEFDLGLPDDVLSLVERFQQEWCNGGLGQVFANWDRADIELIPEALGMIGAAQAAPIIAAAIAEFPDDRDDWRDLGHAAMANRDNPLGARLWELSRALGEHERAMADAVEAFERQLSDGEDI